MTEPDTTKQADATKSTPRPKRRNSLGKVTSTGAAKTIRVQVDRIVQDRMYGKYLKRRTVLHVHDEAEAAKVGDTVEVMECRPISKTKRWRLVRVVSTRG